MKNSAAIRETATELMKNQSRQTNESYQEKQLEIEAHFSSDPYEQNSPTAADDVALEIALERGDA
jgi:hypothetical protein